MSGWIELMLKELRLQRGLMLVAGGGFLLGLLGLWLAKTNGALMGGYAPDDIQKMILGVVLFPVLIIILPVMSGSTAAAAEKPLGVLAWQSALPVARWKVVLAKVLVVSGVVGVIAGVLPYAFHLLMEDQEFFPAVFRGFWIGMFGLYFAAIGFFAGSHSRSDYQGLFVAIIPAVVVGAGLILADPFFRVMPLFMPFPLFYPEMVWARFAGVAAVLVLLASRMHIRVPQRRWMVMSGALVVMFMVAVLLTWLNIRVEGNLLGKPLPYSGEDVARVEARYPARNVVPATPVATLKDGSFLEHNSKVYTLDGGGNIGYLVANNVKKQRGEKYSLVIVEDNGAVQSYDSVLMATLRFMAFSTDPGFMVARSNDRLEAHENILWGGAIAFPGGFSWPLKAMPGFLREKIEGTLDTIQGSGLGWKWPEDKPRGVNDYYTHNGLNWKNGKLELPDGGRLGLIYSNYFAQNVYVGEVIANDTTLTAVLRRGDQEGEVELAGYFKGHVYEASEDGEWVRDFSTTPALYKRALSWEEAQKGSDMKPRIGNIETTTTLADGSLLTEKEVHQLGSLGFPVISAPDGPATVIAYSISEFHDNTQNSNRGKIREIGLIVRAFETGTTTSLPLMQYDAADSVPWNTHELSLEWHSPSKTAAVIGMDSIIVVDMSGYGESNHEDILTSSVVIPKVDGYRLGGFLTSRRFMQVDRDTVFISEW